MNGRFVQGGLRKGLIAGLTVLVVGGGISLVMAGSTPIQLSSYTTDGGGSGSLGIGSVVSGVSAPKAAPKVAPKPAAVVLRNRLVGPNFNVGLDTYSYCTAAAVRAHPLPHNGLVAIDTCVTSYMRTHGYPSDIYFVGHSPGPFTPLLRDGVGSVITYHNAGGGVTRYRIRGSVNMYGCNVHSCSTPLPPRGTTAQFQTCVTPNSSIMRVYYAITI